ncbi:hypothetical protein NKH73_02030 [Mesorhizobium sp. M0938]|uniref:hypothetical protein n=1 Tax=unclassified Mesorhizobium TaxID=325217 RepID=UPI003335D529
MTKYLALLMAASTALTAISQPASANWFEKALHDAGNAVEKGLHDTGNAVEKGLHDTGNAVEKGLHDTGHALEKAGQDVGKFVEEHPWETVAVITFVVGGGYLLVYQGYTLNIAVGEQVVATLTSTELGLGSVATGVGTAVVTASQPPSAVEDAGADSGQQAPKIDTPAGNNDVRSVVELPSLNTPPPALPKNASDIRKLNFAREVVLWTRDSQPIELFNPDDYGNSISPMEKALLEAHISLETVPDSAADAAAKQQAEDRRNFIRDKAKEVGVDLMTGKVPDPKDIAKDVLLEVLTPTTLGDGQSAAREYLKLKVDDELRKYAEKRDPCMRKAFAPECIKLPAGDGPVIHAAP